MEGPVLAVEFIQIYVDPLQVSASRVGIEGRSSVKNSSVIERDDLMTSISGEHTNLTSPGFRWNLSSISSLRVICDDEGSIFEG